MKINRLIWLDISKGIAIILMVLGHASLSDVISRFIYAFHMPLFFIASGWTTNWTKHNFTEFALRKGRTLLIPFAIYSSIVLSLMLYTGWYTSFATWIEKGWGGYALWFVPVLYLALLLSKCIYTLPSRILQYFLFFIVLICGCLLNFYNIILPWALSTVPFAACLIMFGAVAKRWQRYVETPKMYVILLLLAVTFLISRFWGLDMCWNAILPVIPLSIGAICGTSMVFMASSWIEKRVRYLSNILVAIGKETFLILAFSQIIIMILSPKISAHSIVKYCIMVVIFILLKCLKDWINSRLKTKLL